MKRILIFLIFFSILAFSFSDTISIRADSWAPYNDEANSQSPGYVIEIAKYIFKSKGHTIDYNTLPWSRAIIDTRHGKYDAIVGAFKEDAPDFIFPDNEQGVSSTDFFVKTGDNWKYTGVDSLEEKTIGVIRDYSYGEDFDKYIEKYINNTKKVQLASGDSALNVNIKKLMSGRISLTLEDKAVMEYTLKSMGLSNKLKSAGSLGVFELYIAFSPANPKSKDYAKILSDGMAEIRKNGKLKEILEKYGLSDWK